MWLHSKFTLRNNDHLSTIKYGIIHTVRNLCLWEIGNLSGKEIYSMERLENENNRVLIEI